VNLVICEERVVPVLIFATSDNKVYLNKLLCASDKNHAGRKHIVVESELSVLLNDCGSNCLVLKHARSRVLRFEGGNTFLGRQDFCFCYMFKTNFSGHKTTWETRKIFGGHCPRMLPRGHRPVLNGFPLLNLQNLNESLTNCWRWTAKSFYYKARKQNGLRTPNNCKQNINSRSVWKYKFTWTKLLCRLLALLDMTREDKRATVMLPTAVNG